MIDTQKLHKWYNGLYSRTLDLVGDYAGDELFILEGDSLLLHCFSDDQIDFTNGFQLLHATYLVEKFLAQLHQRKYPYFLMCHDGASSGAHAGRRPGLTLENLELSSSDDDSNPSDVEEPGSEIATRETGVMFRSMIHHFICRGYNISLINSLECRDTKTLRALLQPSYRHSFSPTVLSQLEVFESLVKDLCEVDLGFEQRLGFNITTRASKCCTGSERPAGKTARLKDCKSNEQSNIPIAVLPFSNPVLDPHLSPVSLAIDHSAGNLVDVAISRISEELSHWHNHRKTLDTKTIHKLTGWQLRRNQFFMAEMRQYAASLTNSTGGILKPETVFVQSENNNQHRQIQTSRSGMNDGLEGLQLTKNRSTQKSSRSKIRPSSVRDQAAAQQLIKRDEAISRHWKSWRVKILELDQEHNYAARYVKLKQYLQALSNDKRSAIESEVLTYGLSTLVVLWIDKCSSNKRDRSMSVAALIWATTCEIVRKKHDVTEDIAKCLQGTISKLGLPAVEISARSKRPLSFQFAAITSTKVDVNIGLSTLEFQLTQAGPYLDRSMGSAPDPRVYDFEPDKWQREILDQIDARKSLFVVAPTSAGKTFISFYAIKQILEDDNEGVIVYVAPTKALVNQIAAEVQARFSKNFKETGKGIPNDLTLEPRDCWTLWNAMEKYKTAQFPVDESLNPSLALPAFICKANIIQWEAKLKALLKCWMNDDKSPFDAVLNELSYELQIKGQESFQVSSGIISQSDNKRELKRNSILDTTLPLICSLHDQGALPALFFNYDRSHCERICHHLLSQLKEEESRWKASSSAWANDILGWEEWKTEETRSRTQKRKETGRNSKVSKDEQMRETASVEPSKYSSFDPEAPISGFHLADMKKLLPSEFEEYATELRQRLIPEWLIEALRRGIGVHHAGLNRKYRHVCEILFRRGYLRVVIATGTLALGINMPCKTVVFSGDSVFLTALGYRQAAGRAGRRGFDFLGNVVFQGVTYAKVCRLLSSKLPNLNGHFPITTSLVLRLFILLHESKQSPYAVKAINSILSCPRIYLGGPESKHTVLHHLRFSIEYLRRNYLLDQGGAPLNFSNTIAHLYYTGNSSFAFHALLSGGYFHDLCRDIRHKPKQVLLALMLVMSHLFGRQNLRPAILESQQKATKSSTSVVVLPPMPKKAAQILHSHNEKTLNIYSAYVTTYINQHIKDADCFLPLTNCKCGGDTSAKDINPSMPFLPPTQVTSAFVALSGHRDRWNSIPELCKNVRSGVWLEQAVVPYVGLYPKEGKLPLNAYLLDFFKHGNVHALEKDNRVRKGDIWFVLNDFSLVLATIVTSLENFLKLSPNTDPDLLDIMGSGDAHEEELDISFAKEKVSEPENKPLKSSKNKTKGLPKQPSPSMPVKVKKPKVAESWEDEVSDDEPNPEEKEETTTDLAQETPGNLKRKTRKKNTSIHAQSTNVIDHDSFGSIVLDGQGVSLVLEAFRMLQAEFNDKFKAMWA
ncbi:putative helicase, DEAD-box superfamily [Aspergillus oryzae 3.042]|uniref:Putative helicase, DEAD-box superfamily n=1 Tax=Aspergillus oryzae (strain 3.042) TaxID=1160506 RepID=I8ILI6_ASPO3|nr:putative helicase, DEAD-box superfamily [Aspergillus oryzae 3.042]|eukprot:EIT79941.1 putative helicase, DEAD-box superfamily [Aspergillus oryzae 3.042]